MQQHEHQWVDKVHSHSSQHVLHRSSNLVGEASSQCWKPKNGSSELESVVVSFKKEVFPRFIKIYQNKIPGAVVKISAGQTGSNFQTLWRREDEKKNEDLIFTPKLIPSVSKVKFVEVLVDTRICDSEISGIELIGSEFMSHPLKVNQNLIGSEQFSDLVINISNNNEVKTVFTHKIIFSQYSTLDLKLNEINVASLSFEAINALVAFMYTGNLKTSKKFTLRDVLFASYALKVEKMSKMLQKVLNLEKDCIEIINGEEKYPESHVKFCESYMKQNMNKIIQHEAFVELKEENLIKLMKRDDIFMTETILLENILQRWTVKQNLKKDENLKVLKFIRFHLIPRYRLEILKSTTFMTKLISDNDAKLSPRGEKIHFKDSEILSLDQQKTLSEFCGGENGNMIYNSGSFFDLKSFNNSSENTLILLEDTEGNIFGAFLPHISPFSTKKVFLFNFKMKVKDSIIPQQKMELSLQALLHEKIETKTQDKSINIGDSLFISESNGKFSNKNFVSQTPFENDFLIKRIEIFVI
jgi:hypothetical protein